MVTYYDPDKMTLEEKINYYKRCHTETELLPKIIIELHDLVTSCNKNQKELEKKYNEVIQKVGKDLEEIHTFRVELKKLEKKIEDLD